MYVLMCPYRKLASLTAGVATAILMSVSACHHEPPSAPIDSQPAPNSQIGTRQPQTTGATDRPIASRTVASQPVDFESMVHGLARRQRVYVREWYQRIDAPSMNEATPAQMTWMRARHYPMPKDIARADSMTDEELKAAASSGDTKAQILYVARLLDEFSHTFTRGTPAAKYPFRLASEVDQMMPQILASGSPFAGYLYATRERILFPGNVEGNAALQLAGLVWASKFGDTRAKTLMDSATMQAVDPGTAVAAVELMIVKFMYANPRLLSTPVTPIPGRNR